MKTCTIVLALFAFAAWGQTAPSVEKLHPVPLGQVKLLAGTFLERANLNREYVVSLKNRNLLQSFYLEAGLWSPRFRMTAMGEADRGDDIHWGWESPSCQVRGHFLGHWLSAAAYLGITDPEVKGKADAVVAELARVQQSNGGRWAGSIPEKYLFWVAQKKPVWAPHYTLAKTFMGLIDAYQATGNRKALEVAENFALWFDEWTRGFTREQMDDILDVETGAMLEVWADLYGITKKPMYLELMRRYRRGRLFDRLVEGVDALTNKHANTTVPEAHGMARAYEVTGDPKWRAAAEAYWKSAVTDRGYFCTGGQTSGEIWTPPRQFSARLGDKNQEHCVVYNMIRLADYLFRWSGKVEMLDYIERNIYNGILAQQHPRTGMISYFLPLEADAHKVWGSPTNDFWCCHGTLVQAHTRHDRYIYYTDDAGLLVAQYIPSEVRWNQGGAKVRLTLTMERESEDHLLHRGTDARERPGRWLVNMNVSSDRPADFTLKLRLPWWLAGKASLDVNGSPQALDSRPSTFVSVRRTWNNDTLRLTLPKALTVSPLPDRPDAVAFLDGPVVLAAVAAGAQTLYGDREKPSSMLIPDNEREWSNWMGSYRTTGQDRDLRFVPLNTITDERYTVYFPVAPRAR